ncbi:Protein of unknown function [Gryllus bimaculatus]|nr:Protein of unknown function [Gryllus bimaculatus]
MGRVDPHGSCRLLREQGRLLSTLFTFCRLSTQYENYASKPTVVHYDETYRSKKTHTPPLLGGDNLLRVTELLCKSWRATALSQSREEVRRTSVSGRFDILRSDRVVSLGSATFIEFLDQIYLD